MRAGLGTISRSSGIARFVQGGVVKTFRCTTLGQFVADRPTTSELRSRIERHLAITDPIARDRLAIAWSGYLAGLIEWGLLSVSEHAELCELIPPIEDDPSVQILLGTPD